METLPPRTNSFSIDAINEKPNVSSPLGSPPLGTQYDSTVDGIQVDDLLGEASSILLQHQGEESKDICGVVRKLVDKVQTLTGLLSRLQQSQAELQNSLTLTSSNLTLALSNTEMLEEALKRASGGGGKDIGWKRWSDREGAGLSKRASGINGSGALDDLEEQTSKRRPYHGASGSETDVIISRSASPAPGQQGPSATATPNTPNSESRFFKFRFGGSSGNMLNGTLGRQPSSTTQPSHLTSASLPSLATPISSASPVETSVKSESDPNASSTPELALKNRVEELEQQLESERKAREAALSEKAAIESELESLSAALFEEANKMVSSERRKLAETEEELLIAKEEREALKGALKVVELENSGRKEKEERDRELKLTDLGAEVTPLPTPPRVSPSSVSPPKSVPGSPSASSFRSSIPQLSSRLKSLPIPSSTSSPQSSPTKLSIDTETSQTVPDPSLLTPTLPLRLSRSRSPSVSVPEPISASPESLTQEEA